MTARVDQLLHEVERLAAETRETSGAVSARAPPRTGSRLIDGRWRRPSSGGRADRRRDPLAVAEDVVSFTPANGRPPGLAVVIVGRDAPSTVYLERILRGCAKVGIHAEFVELEGEATEASVSATIRDLNADPRSTA